MNKKCKECKKEIPQSLNFCSGVCFEKYKKNNKRYN